MKKNLVIFSIVTLALMLGNFKTRAQTSYSSWQTSSCYRGIDFCVKRAEYNDIAKKYMWYVKFRNRYQQPVSFSFTAKESYIRSAKTTDREEELKPGGEFSSWFLLNEANSIGVFIDQLKFGKDDWGAAYVPCGN